MRQAQATSRAELNQAIERAPPERPQYIERETLVTTSGEEIDLDDATWQHPKSKVVRPKKGDTILIFDDSEMEWIEKVVKTIKNNKILTSGWKGDLDGDFWKYPGKVMRPKEGDTILVLDDDDKWVKQVVEKIEKGTFSVGVGADNDDADGAEEIVVVPPVKGDTIEFFDYDKEKWVAQIVQKVTKNGIILTPDYEVEVTDSWKLVPRVVVARKK